MTFSAVFEYIPKNIPNVKSFLNKNSFVVWTTKVYNRKFNSKFKNKKIEMNVEYCKQDVVATHFLPHAVKFIPKIIVFST